MIFLYFIALFLIEATIVFSRQSQFNIESSGVDGIYQLGFTILLLFCRVTKVGKISGKQWVFHSTEKSIKYFLSNGLSNKLEFCVIISPQP
jgi:hypothetical protein